MGYYWKNLKEVTKQIFKYSSHDSFNLLVFERISCKKIIELNKRLTTLVENL